MNIWTDPGYSEGYCKQCGHPLGIEGTCYVCMDVPPLPDHAKQKARLGVIVDDLWRDMERLFQERQTASPECWSDIDQEYIELEGEYHKMLDLMAAL